MERRVEWANIDNPFLISPAIILPNTETGTCRFTYLLLQRKTSLYIVTSNEALKRIFHSAVSHILILYSTNCDKVFLTLFDENRQDQI